MCALIKNKTDLQNVLKKKIEQKIQNALFLTAQQVYDVIQEHIVDYYNEPVFSEPSRTTPDAYHRIYKFLTALASPEVKILGNKLVCNVGFDENYLAYEYSGNKNSSGKSNGTSVTGLDVITWANSKTHGGNVPGNIEFWNDAIEEMGGIQGIKKRLIDNIKKQGIKIT